MSLYCTLPRKHNHNRRSQESSVNESVLSMLSASPKCQSISFKNDPSHPYNSGTLLSSSTRTFIKPVNPPVVPVRNSKIVELCDHLNILNLDHSNHNHSSFDTATTTIIDKLPSETENLFPSSNSIACAPPQPILPSIPPLPSEPSDYINGLYMKSSLLSSSYSFHVIPHTNSSHIPTTAVTNLSSWSSLNGHQHFSSPLSSMGPPLQPPLASSMLISETISDSATFTESVTSTFEDYASSAVGGSSNSNGSSPPTKLYYASDSIDPFSHQKNLAGANNNIHQKSKAKPMPNFYGTIDEDNFDDGGEDDEDNDSDFQSGSSSGDSPAITVSTFSPPSTMNINRCRRALRSCSVEDITEEENDDDIVTGIVSSENLHLIHQLDQESCVDQDDEDEDYLDEFELRQRERVARLFDLSLASSSHSSPFTSSNVITSLNGTKSTTNRTNTNTITNTNRLSSFRSRSRQSLRNLSIRLSRKFLNKDRGHSTTTTRRASFSSYSIDGLFQRIHRQHANSPTITTNAKNNNSPTEKMTTKKTTLSILSSSPSSSLPSSCSPSTTKTPTLRDGYFTWNSRNRRSNSSSDDYVNLKSYNSHQQHNQQNYHHRNYLQSLTTTVSGAVVAASGSILADDNHNDGDQQQQDDSLMSMKLSSSSFHGNNHRHQHNNINSNGCQNQSTSNNNLLKKFLKRNHKIFGELLFHRSSSFTMSSTTSSTLSSSSRSSSSMSSMNTTTAQNNFNKFGGVGDDILCSTSKVNQKTTGRRHSSTSSTGTNKTAPPPPPAASVGGIFSKKLLFNNNFMERYFSFSRLNQDVNNASSSVGITRSECKNRSFQRSCSMSFSPYSSSSSTTYVTDYSKPYQPVPPPTTTARRRTESMCASIVKKRPLSMTYDLDRILNSCGSSNLDHCDKDSCFASSNHPTTINSINDNQQKKEKAHMVAAFEQSLSSMTTRLQHLSSTSELKDCELERLRKTIDMLKKQGGSLVGHATKSATIAATTANGTTLSSMIIDDKFQRYLSSESVNSVSSVGDNSLAQKAKKKSKLKLAGTNTSWIRSSFSRAFKKKSSKSSSSPSHHRDVASDVEMTSGTGQSEAEGDVHSVPSSPMLSLRRSMHPRSLSESTNSKSTAANATNTAGEDTDVGKETEELKELRKQLREKEMQLTDMRLESLTSAHQLENLKEIVNQMRIEMLNLKQDNDRLQRLVQHKSLASSQSSMTSAIGSHGSSTLPSGAQMTPGAASLMAPINGSMLADDANSFESIDMESPLHSSTNSSNDIHKMVTLGSGSHILATLSITSKTNWEQLDVLIKKCFKDHLLRLDQSLSLGITVDSLACYRVGSEKIQRNFYPINKLNDQQPASQNRTSTLTPELLPYGYLVNESHINLQFKSTIDSLAFDTLTPKSVLNEFITMLMENRRLIFAGPSGTGKTYLAHKLAEYMSIKHMDSSSSTNMTSLSPRSTPTVGLTNGCPSGSITTFNVDHKNSKELRAYLVNIAEQCQLEVAVTPLPTVIILDNLHHSIDSLEDIFNDLKISSIKSPYIIGTINQSVHHHQTMDMFQQHSFHCVMLSVNSEAVKGYLNRYLRRKLLETESRLSLNNQKLNAETIKIIDWIPKVYSHLNKFLENYFGENICIGARLFTSCPIDLNGSQSWFTDLWNYSILPFIIENLRELVKQNDGKLKTRSSTSNTTTMLNSFIDPTDWIVANYPWTSNQEWSDHLNRLRPEDLVDDENNNNKLNNTVSNNQSQNNNNKSTLLNGTNDSLEPPSSKDIKDPFLQMLLKLKEASEYTSQEIHPPLTEQTS